MLRKGTTKVTLKFNPSTFGEYYCFKKKFGGTFKFFQFQKLCGGGGLTNIRPQPTNLMNRLSQAFALLKLSLRI